MNWYDVSGSWVGGDDEVVKCDVGEMSVPSGERGKMAEVLEISDERILMITVHMFDDAFFNSRIRRGW